MLRSFDGTFVPLPATVDAPRRARLALDGWMDGLVGPDRAADVRLLTTELVSNAIRHGSIPPDGEITVDVRTSDSEVTIAVRQPTPAGGVAFRPTEAAEEGGFGLQLVDQLADSWGVDHGIPGTVWFGVLQRPET